MTLSQTGPDPEGPTPVEDLCEVSREQYYHWLAARRRTIIGADRDDWSSHQNYSSLITWARHSPTITLYRIRPSTCLWRGRKQARRKNKQQILSIPSNETRVLLHSKTLPGNLRRQRNRTIIECSHLKEERQSQKLRRKSPKSERCVTADFVTKTIFWGWDWNFLTCFNFFKDFE